MGTGDLPLFAKWVKTPAVAEWWRDEAEMSFEQIQEKMSPRILGQRYVRPYIFLLDEDPVGYIQTYSIDADQEALEMYGVSGANGVDLFIGEQRWLHRGHGAKILKSFIDTHVFSDPEVDACMIDPEVKNEIAIRAYEKAGFRRVRVAESASDGLEYVVMRLNRPVSN